MPGGLTAELDAIAEQRAAEYAARQARTAELRQALAEARAAGKAERHRRRLAREAARTTETSAGPTGGEGDGS